MPGIELLAQPDQRAGDVLVGDRPQDREPTLERAPTEQRADVLEVDGTVCDRLVEQREGITHRPRTRGDDREGVGVGVDALLRAHVGEVRGELVDRVERELEVLGAGADRGRDLQRIGRREHEHHVLGRLLQRLQQRRLRAAAEHVHLVEDVRLLGAAGTEVRDPLEEIAHLVDLAA